MKSFLVLFLVWFLFFFPFTSQVIVPKSQTFSFLIQGIFQGLLEGNRINFLDVGIHNSPFSLCICSPTSKGKSNVHHMTLAIRLDTRIVWEANRGTPVHNNSTLEFVEDGNFILAESNGDVVWQTHTSNKGVVDLKLLSNGNLVLLDKKGEFVWQSFDHPTDTILVDQSLLPGEHHKLISRTSPFDNRNGPYSLVLEGKRLVLYYQGKHSKTPEIYSKMKSVFTAVESLLKHFSKVTLRSDFDYEFELYLNMTFASDSRSINLIFAQPNINTTYSYFQLGHDGNVRFYTSNDKANQSPWNLVFVVFYTKYVESECQLPEKCGQFGVCENNRCVACPTPLGLKAWSKECAPPKLNLCNGESNVSYYKLVGVDHFSSNFAGNAPVKFDECKKKCTKDCSCLGFFYREVSSTCLVTSQLNTLSRISNNTHLAFIKMAM